MALFALVASGLAGCQPNIGDKCVLNTDCSVSGTRQCDTSLPGGYCTIFNCGPNSCPDQSACYLFHSEVQGCPYSDRVPSRTAHSFCMKDCQHNGDCRPGYICKDLRTGPWNAILLDDNQNQMVCVPQDDTPFDNSAQIDANAPEAPICQANPDIDAAFAEPPDAGIEAVDAASDAGAGRDASDAGGDVDATLDAAVDATTDAGTDAAGDGASDATID